MDQSSIIRVEVFSRWAGFADPSSQVAKLQIARDPRSYRREQLPDGLIDDIPFEAVEKLSSALSRRAVATFDAELFDVPERVIRRHYGSCWTDDYPSLLVRTTYESGRVITIQTDVQQAFMLPLHVKDSRSEEGWHTYDPSLSKAIANLMPEDYLGKDRLAGSLGMLEWDLKEFEAGEFPPANELAPFQSDDEDSQSQATIPTIEDALGEIFRKLHGEESPEEKADAVEAGQWSERLLKRIPYEEMRECLRNGANPSIADDVGQTALMHAAFPPFEFRRFRLLVDAGADVGACRNDGLNGLQIACLGGESRAVEEWVRAGASIHLRSPEGATPLMLGARWGEIVATLLAAGADVNAVDPDGHSALVYAIIKQTKYAEAKCLDAVKTLIDAATELNRRDREGITPLGHAKRVFVRLALKEEVFQEFHPERDFKYKAEEHHLAKSIIDLIAAAGGYE